MAGVKAGDAGQNGTLYTYTHDFAEQSLIIANPLFD